MERADLLKPKVYPHGGALTPLGAGKPKFRPTFILTFHPHGPNLRKWLGEAYPILMSDKKLKEIYPSPPSVVYRQPANLRQILICSALKKLPFSDCSDREERDTPGCYKHIHPNRGRKCATCPRLQEGKTFKSTFTGRQYKIWNRFTCKSSYSISPYLQEVPGSVCWNVHQHHDVQLDPPLYALSWNLKDNHVFFGSFLYIKMKEKN